jgi:hypothetical protein
MLKVDVAFKFRLTKVQSSSRKFSERSLGLGWAVDL